MRAMANRVSARRVWSSSRKVESPSPKELTDLLQVVGQRGAERAPLAGRGVVEAESVGVEERPPQRHRRAGATISDVAHDRVPNGSQVDPHLMRAPRLQRALDERRFVGLA